MTMTEKEYIERGEILDALAEVFPTTSDEGEKALIAAWKVIKKLPAADVIEVVRCKDCKRFVENKAAYVTYCKRGLKNQYVKPDDFCSYGERKE
jgi:hypothetical protein